MDESREAMLRALAEDEEEAIEAYQRAIAACGDEHMIGQLEKILAEEEAHLAYLEEAMSDPEAEYEDPSEAIAPEISVDLDWMEAE